MFLEFTHKLIIIVSEKQPFGLFHKPNDIIKEFLTDTTLTEVEDQHKQQHHKSRTEMSIYMANQPANCEQTQGNIIDTHNDLIA